MVAFAFETLAAPEVIASCHPDNAASIRLINRLGMQLRGDELWYGEIGPTFSLSRENWMKTRSSASLRRRSVRIVPAGQVQSTR